MISWFGGEPLLEMEVIDYVSQKVMEICRKAHKPYTAAVTSNGYLLSRTVQQRRFVSFGADRQHSFYQDLL